MTTGEVMMLRQRVGWVSPLKPLERGEQVLLFSQRGTYEFLMHPDDALKSVALGLVIDGEKLECRVVDCHPLMNALTIRARQPEANQLFIEAKAA